MNRRPLNTICAALLVSVAIGAAGACGGDGLDATAVDRCLAKCDEARAASCIDVNDCVGFCRSGFEVVRKAQCAPQLFEAWDTCASAQAACDVERACDAPLQDLLDCTVPFCLQNADDADCQAYVAATN